jgi:hypothetical protein
MAERDYYNEDDAWRLGSGSGNYAGTPDPTSGKMPVDGTSGIVPGESTGGKGNDPYHDWNGGSPPNAPLEPGRGWVWEGETWRQATGTGLGYTPPRTGGGGAPPPTGGGGGGYQWQEGYSDWNPGDVPNFDAPRWQAPPEFSYGGKFNAPNAQELQMDPSFQFRLDQGRKALEQSAAGKGVLRTGGTLKDLVNYGQNFATNEYSNVYNRKFGEYKFDYDKEADIYARNYNLKRDVFDRNYKAAYDEYSPKLKGWETNTNIKARQQESLFNREWQKYLADRGFEQKDVELNPY